MTAIELIGHINDTGELEVEGTTGLRPGTKVKVLVIEAENGSNQNLRWGANVVELLNTLDLGEWETLDIPDATEWVRKQRRGQDWGNS